MARHLTEAGKAFFRGDYQRMGEYLKRYSGERAQKGGPPPMLKLDGQKVNGDTLFAVLSDIHVTL